MPKGRCAVGGNAVGKATSLRVDAQRNLRHVLSAARDVFGEQGYGAPMEEVARRARVGVGTVYRRFPNKEALVRYIAEEETQRLTARAREALALDEEPWGALEDFVQRSAAGGAGRLLPPELLVASASAGAQERVPRQRGAAPGGGGEAESGAGAGSAGPAGAGGGPQEPAGAAGGGASERPAGCAAESAAGNSEAAEGEAGAEGAGAGEAAGGGARELLSAVGQLVERTRAAGQLRPDVTVADLMLVIATTPPRIDDPARQTAVGGRLLQILLQGLRSERC
nr:TetR/AcrR family transcriptional regulator [Streptomyces hoynatensis]